MEIVLIVFILLLFGNAYSENEGSGPIDFEANFAERFNQYLGHIKNNLAGGKDVKGLIIALEDDKNLRDALSVAPNIKFMKYEVSFKLVG